MTLAHALAASRGMGGPGSAAAPCLQAPAASWQIRAVTR